MKEKGKVKSTFIITKFKDPKGVVERFARMGKPLDILKRMFAKYFIEEKVIHGNIFLNEGINLIWTAVCGGSYTPFDNAHAHIGVGDGTQSADATQTGLQGTNKYYKGMDEGYPKYGTDQKAVFRATFGGTEANFCYTPDHEVLTIEGWKPIADVNIGDFVAVIKPNGAITYLPVVDKTIFHHRGYIYEIENERVSLAVSPEHKVYVRNDWWRRRGEGFDLIEIERLEKGTWEMKKDGLWSGLKPREFVIEGIHSKFHPWLEDAIYLPVEPFVKLLGYVLSEGYVMQNSVVICQNKDKHPEIYNDIIETIKECGFTPKEYNGTHIMIHDKRLAQFIKKYCYVDGTRAYNKKIPDFVKWLTPELIETFIDAFIKGDGHLKDRVTPIIYTTSPYIRDGIQELALKMGLCADWKAINNTKSFSNRTKYVISIVRRYKTPYVVVKRDDKRRRELKKIPYDGLLVGIAVPEYHTLYVRRYGKAVWSGNSWNEWTVANGASDDAINLNRKVESLGTKAEGTTWIFTVELSLS